MSEKPNQEASLADDLEHLVQDAKQAGVSAEAEIKALNEAEIKANQHWEQTLRLQAEIENMKRRAEKELANAHKYATEKFVKELLAVIDSLELALQNSGAETTAFKEGIELTQKLFSDTLFKHGVVAIEGEGEPFNPEQHQAVTMQPDVGVDPNTVLKVVQKGYSLHGRLIRPAMVVVSQ